MPRKHVRERLDDGVLHLTKANIETRQGISMSVPAELGEAIEP